jgi:hypothetical protein
MSLLNINSANQSEISGKLVVTVVSGSTAVVAIAGTPGGSTFADVQSSVASDNVATTTDVLATQGLAYGYNQQNDDWARVRIVPHESGQNTILGSSGFSVQTVGLTYGYYPKSGAWNRIATAFASGATGVTQGDQFYSGHSLVVSMGDGGILAHVTPTTDDAEDGTNSLFTVGFNMGYDGAWYRIGAQVNTRGNTLGTYPGPAGDNIDIESDNDVTAASGGQTLTGIDAKGPIYLQARANNSGWIRVGGNNAGDFPTQNDGFQLAPGEHIVLYLSNTNLINVVAQVSGDAVNYLVIN